MLKVVTEVDLEVVRLNRPNMVRDIYGIQYAIRRYGLVTPTLQAMCIHANMRLTDLVGNERYILPQYDFKNLNHYKFLELIVKLLETQEKETSYNGLYLETWKFLTIQKLMEDDL